MGMPGKTHQTGSMGTMIGGIAQQSIDCLAFSRRAGFTEYSMVTVERSLIPRRGQHDRKDRDLGSKCGLLRVVLWKHADKMLSVRSLTLSPTLLSHQHGEELEEDTH